MLKRILCLAIVIGLCSSSFAAVNKVAKSGAKKAVKKVVKPVKKAVSVKKAVPAKVSAPAELSEETSEKNAELREDMNKAIAELKGQLDKVKSDNSDAKVSGEIRFAWTKGISNVTTKNNFDISRAYVTVRKNLAGGASARVTLDVSRLTPTTTSPQALFDYIKYAYVDVPVAIPSYLQVVPFSMTAKLGLQHNMWIDWADKAWDNAWVMKQFDDNESIMSSADFGLGATGKFTLPYMNEIEYHATLMNGGGYKVAESDSAKDIGLRLNTTLYQDDNLGKVIAGGYVNSKAGILNTGSANTKQAALLVAIDNENYGKAYAEYMKGTKINGYSVGGFIFPMTKSVVPVALVARFDNYDPNNTVSTSNDVARSLIGAIYEYSKDVKFALDLQTYKSGSSAEQKTAYLHSVIYY